MADGVDVFIAHASADEDVAVRLSQALTDAGRSAFIYQENLGADAHFRTTDAVLNTEQPVVVLIASEAAADSEHVQREVTVSVHRALPRVIVYRNLDPSDLDPAICSALALAGENGTVVGDEMTDEQTERILAMVEAAAPRAQPNSRRAQEVVGRDHDFEQVLALVERNDRPVINIHGAPGAGKSTIATWVAEEAHRRGFVDELTDVPLERQAREADEIAQLVASALELETGGRQDRAIAETVGAELSRRGRILLKVENIEYVTMDAERLLLEWVSLAPRLRILATSSRTFLEPSPHVTEYPLPPLSVPTADAIDTVDPAVLIEKSAAIQLFLSLLPDHEVAPARVRKALEGDAEVIRHIARLCAVLGGFPYPIRLAAKPFAVKGGDLRKLIRRNEEFLRAHPDEPDDRQYMYAATETQLELLPKYARLAYLQCAQFEGPISDDAAEEILLDPGKVSSSRVLDQLTEYHLLDFDDTDDRYTLSLPIKQYGRSVWEAQTTEEQRAEHDERFCEYFVELARTAIGRDIEEDERDEAREAVDLDRENLLQATKLSSEGEEVPELTLAVARSLLVHGPLSAVVELVPDALDAVPESRPDLRVELLVAQSEGAWATGEFEQAVSLAEEAVRAAESVDDDVVEAHALFELGKNLGYVARRGEERIAMVQAAVDELDTHPEQADELIVALLTLAASADEAGHLDEADRHIKHAYALADEHAHIEDFLRGRIRSVEAVIAWHDGRAEVALEGFQEAERLFAAASAERWQAYAMTDQAFALADLGPERLDEARRLCDNAHVKHMHVPNREGALVNSSARAKALFLAGRTADAIEVVDGALNDRLGDDYAQNRALLVCVRAESYWADRDERAAEALAEAIDLLDTTDGDLLLRRFRVGVAYADCLLAADDRAGAVEQLRDLREVRRVRRINANHPVWHIVAAFRRYTDLRDQLFDDDL